MSLKEAIAQLLLIVMPGLVLALINIYVRKVPR
jgi:hypothetical protein